MPSPGRGPHVPLPRVRRGQHGHSRHLSLGTRRSALGLVRTLIAADLPSWPCEFDSGIPHYTDPLPRTGSGGSALGCPRPRCRLPLMDLSTRWHLE